MASPKAMLLLQLLAALSAPAGAQVVFGLRSRSCLNNATFNHTSRKNVTFQGRDTPLIVTSMNWATAKINALFYKIVVEEMIGVNVIVSGEWAASHQGYRSLACTDPTTSAVPGSNFEYGCCERVEGLHGHIVIEAWGTSIKYPERYLNSECPDQKPIHKGDLGHEGVEPTFVMDWSLAPAQSTYHLPLQYYASYSNQRVPVKDFFDDWTSISASETMFCNESRLGKHVAVARDYNTHWGFKDPNGTVTRVDSQGRTVLAMNCGGAGDGRWWLSPTCRQNLSRCIPFVTGGDGWMIDEILQKATAWNMPLAVAVTKDWATYTVLPKRRRMIFYWWWPDPLFAAQRPKKIIFPTINKAERATGNVRTAVETAKLSKFATYAVANRSNVGFQRPLGTLENMQFTPQAVDDILAHYIRLGGTRDIMEELVCGWLNNNTDKWFSGTDKWLPEETTCEEGQGLLSASGQWVESRAVAQSCDWCSPGRVSERIAAEATFKCRECGTGTFQGTKGETECTPCDRGTIAPQTGMAACTRCARGQYADRTGQSTCLDCMRGVDGAPDFLTEFEGATSRAQCICPEGFYRDGSPLNRDRCLACETGMTCPVGSDALGFDSAHAREYRIVPLLDRGYWSSAADPLNVFRCDGELRCPGNRRPGNACLTGLKNVQGCAHCEDNTVWNGEACTMCTDRGLALFVFPILPLLLAPTLVIIMYKMFGDTYKRWGTWQNGCAATVFILLNHYQIVNIIRASNLRWDNTVSMAMDVFAVASDVVSIFRPGCAGFGDFRSQLIMRALVPVFLAGVYVVVFGLSQLVGKRIPALKMEFNRTLNGFFSLIFTFFAGISEASFTVFKCVPNPNGTESLKADYSITCYESDWNSMVVIGALAVLFTVFGFGTLFISSIITAPRNFHNKNVQMRWKFLFIRYRPDVHWWAVAFVLKGVYFNLASVVVKEGIWQLYFIMAGLLLYQAVLSIYRPWRHMPNTGMDFWAHLSLLMAACTAVWYAVGALNERAPADDGMTTALTVFLFTCLLPCPVILPYLIVQQHLSSFQESKDRNVELIIDAFEVVAVADKEERELFLQHLNEWDFWFMIKAKDIVQMNLARRRTRSGYSIHELDDVTVRSRDSTTGRRTTRISTVTASGANKRAMTPVRF